MNIAFRKYHALENDFLVVEAAAARIAKNRLPQLAKAMCDRRRGIGADGIAYLSASRKADRKIDIYNSDGSWAEKSGNGLRIAGVHLATLDKRRREFTFETAGSVDRVELVKKISGGFVAGGRLGRPEFRASKVPVRSRHKFLINTPLKMGGITLPVTCLAVGNPHAVILVDNFDFDWQELGAEIETAPAFPNNVNVEFVKVVSRRKLRVADWERGAGPTGSSGTGAAAGVAAMVLLGLVDRHCEVVFRTGSLTVDWDDQTDVISVTGPVVRVMEGVFNFLPGRAR